MLGLKQVHHIAIIATDYAASKAFYCDVLGCAEGRSTDTWLDIDFFGHGHDDSTPQEVFPL